MAEQQGTTYQEVGQNSRREGEHVGGTGKVVLRQARGPRPAEEGEETHMGH